MSLKQFHENKHTFHMLQTNHKVGNEELLQAGKQNQQNVRGVMLPD